MDDSAQWSKILCNSANLDGHDGMVKAIAVSPYNGVRCEVTSRLLSSSTIISSWSMVFWAEFPGSIMTSHFLCRWRTGDRHWTTHIVTTVRHKASPNYVNNIIMCSLWSVVGRLQWSERVSREPTAHINTNNSLRPTLDRNRPVKIRTGAVAQESLTKHLDFE